MITLASDVILERDVSNFNIVERPLSEKFDLRSTNGHEIFLFFDFFVKFLCLLFNFGNFINDCFFYFCHG